MQMCARVGHVNAKQTYAKFAYVQVHLRMQIGTCIRGL